MSLKPKIQSTWGTVAWRWLEHLSQRFSAGAVMFTTMVLLLSFTVAGRWWSNYRQVENEVFQFTYTEPTARGEEPGRPRRVTLSGPSLADPMARYAERLREGTALSVGLSLAYFDEIVRAQRVPATLGELQTAAAQRGLLPPSWQWSEKQQVFASVWGLAYVRFRPRPFGLEVISVGTDGLSDGEIFLLRVPDDSGRVQRPEDRAPAQSWAALWIADNDAGLPVPFSRGDWLRQAGWRLDTLRPGADPAQLTELLRWLGNAQKR